MSRVRVLLNSPINRPGLHRHDVPPSSFLFSPRRYILRARILLSSFSSSRRRPGSRGGPFIFYHRASPLARHRVPPSLRLQVARNSLQPPPSSPHPPPYPPPLSPPRLTWSVSSFVRSSVRPFVRSIEVRKYRLVCPMTRRLLLLLVRLSLSFSLVSFFPG